jgi:hypothetical protein
LTPAEHSGCATSPNRFVIWNQRSDRAYHAEFAQALARAQNFASAMPMNVANLRDYSAAHLDIARNKKRNRAVLAAGRLSGKSWR